MALAAMLASRLSSLSPTLFPPCDPADETASVSSSQDTCSSMSTSSASTSVSTSPSNSPSLSDAGLGALDCTAPPLRCNEHLAVLLDRRRWKPDSQASYCDIFLCQKRFSMRERRHHCRKCGSVVCADCSARITPLLDVSNLDFLHPPRGVPITTFDSPSSPVKAYRVCDPCWDQLHGIKMPRSPPMSHALPLATVSKSGSTSSSSSILTPPDGSPAPITRPALRRSRTASPLIMSSPLRNAHVSGTELSFGELDAYPLKHASAICKATGGGRWEPKPMVTLHGYRVPGGKAPYEIEMEREEEEERLRRLNPVIKHGEFQLRAPREIEPSSPGGPTPLPTF